MKQNVIALVFGGRSSEHSVALRSASTIHAALMALGHRVHCVGIDREGSWRYQGEPGQFPGEVDLSAPLISIRPGNPSLSYTTHGSDTVEIAIDLLFPALHGRWGEDGTIQGLAAMCGLPCVGSGVLGSAMSMDKDVTKTMVQSSGLVVGPWRAMNFMRPWEELVECLGSSTLFVKPANSGSSIGVSKVSNALEYAEAFAIAACQDTKVLVEAEICGREIECGVLELEGGLMASVVGEILKKEGHGYYDYQAKYDCNSGADLRVPCLLPPDIVERIQALSVQAFRCLDLKGYARVDFFLTEGGSIILNEVNTLPGFTSSSMYPKMFECSGYPPVKLVGALVEYALSSASKDRITARPVVAVSQET
ncbi:D-alanine--D-alanine ligase family protein [Pseudomonas sp. NPDC089743]|uniref:D-alanine--D-alanine ligase family protein n=1 Tax=Pseudomonas sp. NPDC089743 TaxID=3364471 RepID=UPI0037FA69EC